MKMIFGGAVADKKGSGILGKAIKMAVIVLVNA